MMSPLRWRMTAYAAILFIAGMITGASVMAHRAAGSQTLKLGRSAEIATMMKQRFDAMEFTQQQWQKFNPLVERTAQELEASHEDCLKRISTAVDALHVQMLPDLNPEQRKQMEKLEVERRAMIREKYNYPLAPVALQPH